MKFTIRTVRDYGLTERLSLTTAFFLGSCIALIFAMLDRLPDWVLPCSEQSFLPCFLRFTLPIVGAYLLGLSPLGLLTLPLLCAGAGWSITASSAAVVLHAGGRAFLDTVVSQGPGALIALSAFFITAVPAFSCAGAQGSAMLSGGSVSRDAFSRSALTRLALCCAAAALGALFCMVLS